MTNYNTTVTVLLEAKAGESIQKVLNDSFGPNGKVTQAAKNAGVAVRDIGVSINEAGNKAKVSVRNFKRFRMELLGIMFFGMALSNVFKENTNRMDEMYGITTLNSAAMDYLLIPAYEMWYDTMTAGAMAVFGMDEGMRALFGTVILGVQQAGGFLAFIGQAGLGIDSLRKYLPTAVDSLKKMYSTLTDINTYKGLFGTIKTKFKSMWTWISSHPITTGIIIGVGLFLTLASLADQWDEIKEKVEATQNALRDYQKEIEKMAERLKGYTGDAGKLTIDMVSQEALDRIDELNGYIDKQKEKVQALHDEWGGIPADINDLLGITDKTEYGIERNKLLQMEERARKLQADYDKGFFLDPQVVESSISNLLDTGLSKGLDTFQRDFIEQYADMIGGVDDAITVLRAKVPGLSAAQKTELDEWGKKFQGVAVALDLGIIDLSSAQSNYNDLMTEFEQSDVFGILSTAGSDLQALSSTMTQVVDPAWERATNSFEELTSNFSLTVDLSMENIKTAIGDGTVDMETANILASKIDEEISNLSSQIVEGGDDVDTAVNQNLQDQIDAWESLKQGIIDGAAGLKTEATKTKSKLASIISNLSGGVFDNIFEAMSKVGINIPGFATGGIVTKPTLAMVGENGPEAIVPLDGSGSSPFGGEINIYVNAPISNTQDAHGLVDQVVSLLRRELSAGTLI